MRSALGFVVLLLWCRVTNGDPQTTLLREGCSPDISTTPDFASIVNDTLADLRSSLSDSTNALFATTHRPAFPSVYALFQCRAYLSAVDCLACYSAAEGRIRNCSNTYSGSVCYDGCFLHFSISPFFDQAISLNENGNLCGGRNASIGGSNAAVRALVADLNAATPRIPKFFAAAEREGVFAVAQCAETVSEEACEQCLAMAVDDVMLCLPSADGRAMNVGCFLRYSDEPFFPANRTVDLSPYLTNSARNVMMKHRKSEIEQ